MTVFFLETSATKKTEGAGLPRKSRKPWEALSDSCRGLDVSGSNTVPCTVIFFLTGDVILEALVYFSLVWPGDS